MPTLALQIVGDLIGRRLTDVDDGLASEVLSRDPAVILLMSGLPYSAGSLGLWRPPRPSRGW